MCRSRLCILSGVAGSLIYLIGDGTYDDECFRHSKWRAASTTGWERQLSFAQGTSF